MCIRDSCYALLLANKDLAPQFQSSRDPLLLAAGLGITAIILDAAQYVFGYVNVQKALSSESQLFPQDWSWRARQACFLSKQVFAYTGAVVLLGVIASRLT